jgi:hypothetical protein
MLARKNYIFLGFQASIAISLLSGCVITESPTGAGGTSSDATTTTTAATTAAATTGGEGGTVATGTTTGTGGTTCVGEDGDATLIDCDSINISPKAGASSSCGPNLDEAPPGYGLCQRGFTIFNTGAATNLRDCLATIGVQDECKTDPLQVCVDKMFNDECVIPSIATSCGEIKTACDAAADPFDTAKCTADLNPFSDAGLKELSDCINQTDPAINCQTAYEGCYTQVLTF